MAMQGGQGIAGKLMGGLQSLGGKLGQGFQEAGQGFGGMGGSDSVQGLMRAMMLQNALRNNMIQQPGGGGFGESLSQMLPLLLMGMGGKQPMSGATGFGADMGGGLPPGSLLQQQNLQRQMHPPGQNPMLSLMSAQQQNGG